MFLEIIQFYCILYSRLLQEFMKIRERPLSKVASDMYEKGDRNRLKWCRKFQLKTNSHKRLIS